MQNTQTLSLSFELIDVKVVKEGLFEVVELAANDEGVKRITEDVVHIRFGESLQRSAHDDLVHGPDPRERNGGPRGRARPVLPPLLDLQKLRGGCGGRHEGWRHVHRLPSGDHLIEIQLVNLDIQQAQSVQTALFL